MIHNFRFFNLGVFDGGEIDMMLNIMSSISNTNIEIIGFEPNPILYNKLCKKYENKPNIKIINVALGPSETNTYLYLNSNFLGSSIYKDKNNVIPGKQVLVQMTRLSTWIENNLPVIWKTDKFNIIKTNIEGAEWEIWQDIKRSGLIDSFCLWLGGEAGHSGWSIDLLKIPSMKHLATQLNEELKNFGIFIYKFSSLTPNRNSDIESIIRKIINEKK